MNLFYLDRSKIGLNPPLSFGTSKSLEQKDLLGWGLPSTLSIMPSDNILWTNSFIIFSFSLSLGVEFTISLLGNLSSSIWTPETLLRVHLSLVIVSHSLQSLEHLPAMKLTLPISGSCVFPSWEGCSGCSSSSCGNSCCCCCCCSCCLTTCLETWGPSSSFLSGCFGRGPFWRFPGL